MLVRDEESCMGRGNSIACLMDCHKFNITNTTWTIVNKETIVVLTISLQCFRTAPFSLTSFMNGLSISNLTTRWSGLYALFVYVFSQTVRYCKICFVCLVLFVFFCKTTIMLFILFVSRFDNHDNHQVWSLSSCKHWQLGNIDILTLGRWLTFLLYFCSTPEPVYSSWIFDGDEAPNNILRHGSWN